MRNPYNRKALIGAGLLAATLAAVFLAQAAVSLAEQIESGDKLASPSEPVSPVVDPVVDPDVPTDPPIPDPYLEEPAPVVIDETVKTGDWLRVTYLVYSGLPNPSVLLAPGDEFSRVESALEQSVARPEQVIDAYSPEPVLGYNGILLERISEGVPRYSYTIRGNTLSTGPESESANYAIVSGSIPRLESALIEIGTSHNVLDGAMLSVIRDGQLPVEP